MNEQLLNELTRELGDNRGIAKRVIRIFEDYDVEKLIAGSIGDLKYCEDEDELAEYFYDWVDEWENEPNSDEVGFMIDLLCAWHCNYDRQSGIGYLADLMAICYKYARPDEDIIARDMFTNED